ncbi:MAG: CDP-alcohol phosphatidyltransferase family protein [Proteobacteria bacterium]|nr:CDP-alcohol phosphatidyltransferase family protein [Pseudomonadota bacterium]
MIKAKLGDRLDGWIHQLFPFLFKRSLDPNLLTVTGSVVSLAAALAYAFGHFSLGGVLLLAGGFFDLVDGVVARHFGRTTAFGAFLDSTLDRFVDMAVLLGIVAHYGLSGRPGMLTLTSIVLIMSVLTSYTKAKAEQVIPYLKGGTVERGERVGLLAFGSLSGLMVPALWLLAIGTTATVAQRFLSAHEALGEKDLLEAAPAQSEREREQEQELESAGAGQDGEA